MSTPRRRISLGTLPWEVRAEGARHKIAERHSKRVRLLEVADVFVELDWCTKGHVVYVLEGRLELSFDASVEELGPGDAVVLRTGETDKHKARALTSTALLFVVEDV